ncbi:MAG: response regulator transcription factor [Desulfobacterales bacterium]|nr:MAG: response regulator transcription factor [Desulfobacterales bacterium]
MIKEKKILVLDANEQSRQELCKILKSQHYPTTTIDFLQELGPRIEKEDCLAVIIDIDSVPVDNRTIRNLALKYPGVRFLCTSKDRFHPELKDAICYHIYACLNKPVDPDELLYWIKCIYEEESQDV